MSMNQKRNLGRLASLAAALAALMVVTACGGDPRTRRFLEAVL
jgi:hypothetical protein